MGYFYPSFNFLSRTKIDAKKITVEQVAARLETIRLSNPTGSLARRIQYIKERIFPALMLKEEEDISSSITL